MMSGQMPCIGERSLPQGELKTQVGGGRKVYSNPIGEGHVLLVDDQATHALLSVTAAELVAQLGSAGGAHADLLSADERN